MSVITRQNKLYQHYNKIITIQQYGVTLTIWRNTHIRCLSIIPYCDRMMFFQFCVCISVSEQQFGLLLPASVFPPSKKKYWAWKMLYHENLLILALPRKSILSTDIFSNVKLHSLVHLEENNVSLSRSRGRKLQTRNIKKFAKHR